MLNFERASLTQKLTSMCLLATASALLVAYLAFALDPGRSITAAPKRMELAALAKVAAANSLDALQFNDRRLAGQVLAALQEKSNLRSAVLYDRKGRPFAAWRAAGSRSRRAARRCAELGPADLREANRQGSRPWLPAMRVYLPVGDAAGDGRRPARSCSKPTCCRCGSSCCARWA